MPELPPTILNFAVSSKSSTSPSFQMQKVLCVGCFSGVHSPVMAPSRTDQKVGSASQPVRSWPLKIGLKPACSAVAAVPAPAARAASRRRRAEARGSMAFPGDAGGRPDWEIHAVDAAVERGTAGTVTDSTRVRAWRAAFAGHRTASDTGARRPAPAQRSPAAAAAEARAALMVP